MARLVAPGGAPFVRDRATPGSLGEVAHLVATYAGPESPQARALFEASPRAALTPDEVRSLVRGLGFPADSVAMTSDRHWTWTVGTRS